MQKLTSVILGEEFKSVMLDFTSDKKYLILGDESGRVYVFDWREGQMVRQWQEQFRKIFKVKVAEKDGIECVISSSRDGSVVITSLNGEVLNSVSHGVRGDASYGSLSFDEDFLATASVRDNNVFIWDLENGIELLPLSGHEEPITQVEFVDNDTVVSASKDGTVRVWSSLSWQTLLKEIKEGDKVLSPRELLQKAVRVYLYKQEEDLSKL